MELRLSALLRDGLAALTRPIRRLVLPCSSFENIFEQAPEGIMVHEPDTGEIVAINSRACEMFEYDREAARRLTVDDLIAGEPPFDSEHAAEVTQDVLQNGLQTVEWRYRRSTDATFWGEVKLQTIQFRCSRRILAVVNDVTDRKHYEQSLREAERSAKRANQFKSSVLTNLSHAVRTPLTAILGYADILETEVEGEAHRFASQIKRSGHVLEKTYSGLLELAELEASSRDLTPEQIDVVVLAGSVVQAYRTQAEAQDITLELVPPDAPCTGTFDRAALTRILEELIDNALAYTDAGGSVRVAVTKMNGGVLVEVTDTGRGVSASFRPKMFEAFSREQTMDSSESRGAGIGLAIVRGLADLMGGTVDAESKKNVGTRITVQVPSI